MWIFTNSGFISIVADRDAASNLLVRGRREGDIETIFPRAKVTITPNADYLYRASVTRQTAANAVAMSVLDIQYNNFKNSVLDPDRHEYYLDVWTVMRRMQEKQYQDSSYPQSWYDPSIT